MWDHLVRLVNQDIRVWLGYEGLKDQEAKKGKREMLAFRDHLVDQENQDTQEIQVILDLLDHQEFMVLRVLQVILAK